MTYLTNYDLVVENTSLFIFIGVILVVAILLLGLNYILTPSVPDPVKVAPFECGLSSFNQSRVSFSVIFVLVAILFLPFDLEVSCILPFGVCFYNLQLFGFIILSSFLGLLTLGFIFEIYQEALKIHSKQNQFLDS